MSELNDMVDELDQDGNGTVEFPEFVILMSNKIKKMTKEDEVYEAFMCIDKDKDDFITEKELKYFARKVARMKITNEEAAAMVQFADRDKDGIINLDDYIYIINKYKEMQQKQHERNLKKKQQ